jgi:translation initiation factor 4E
MSRNSPLNDAYNLYYTDDKKNVKNYEDRIHLISAPIATADSLVSYLSHLRPLAIPGTDYHLFKAAIRPLWEDAGNRAGGKFIIRTKRGQQTMAVFTSLVLAFCGGGFGEALESEICGVVARARSAGFSVCVWHRTAGDFRLRTLLETKIRQILAIADSVLLEHETHDGSLAMVVSSISLSFFCVFRENLFARLF